MTIRGLILCAGLLFLSCDQQAASPTGSAATATGTATAVPILAPFQGKWTFNLDKTLAKWKVDGATATEIAQAQALAKMFPLHPNMELENDTALLAGPVEGSYQFFALHPHKQIVCGKAWHHEDRHDPGDMDKYLTRLELRGSDLHLSVRTAEDAADPNDPDVTTMPLTSGSAQTCTADKEPSPQWSAWQTFVFDRGN